MRFGSLRTPFPFAHPGLADRQEAAALLRNLREGDRDMTEFRDIKIITDLEQGTSREVRT